MKAATGEEVDAEVDEDEGVDDDGPFSCSVGLLTPDTKTLIVQNVECNC